MYAMVERLTDTQVLLLKTIQSCPRDNEKQIDAIYQVLGYELHEIEPYYQMDSLQNDGYVKHVNFQHDTWVIGRPIELTAKALGYLETGDLVKQIILKSVERLNAPEHEKQTLTKKLLSQATEVGGDLLVKFAVEACSKMLTGT